MNIFGIVEKVVERTVNTKRGPTPVFDIYVDGTKYSWGFQRPTKFGITDGAEIKFQATPDKYGPKVEVESVEVVTNGSGAAPVKVAPKTALDEMPELGGNPVDLRGDALQGSK